MDIKTLTGYNRAKITFYPPLVKSKEHIGSANIKLFQRTGSTALKSGKPSPCKYFGNHCCWVILIGFFGCTAEVQ